MTDCSTLHDRMPDVANDLGEWTESENAHLATCSDCAAEWALVEAAVRAYAYLPLDVDRVEATVLRRLRTEPVQSSPVRQLQWRGAVVATLAAAASVVLVLSMPSRHRSEVAGSGDSAAALAVLPELGRLDDGQLNAVLQAIEPASPDVAVPGESAHLDDLTDAQLAKLLRAMGGE